MSARKGKREREIEKEARRYDTKAHYPPPPVKNKRKILTGKMRAWKAVRLL